MLLLDTSDQFVRERHHFRLSSPATFDRRVGIQVTEEVWVP
jgi:hypothetical protein